MANVMLILIGRFAISPVVLIPGQQCDCLFHFGQVKAISQVKRAAFAQERFFIGVDKVIISAEHCVKAGMRLAFHGKDTVNGYVIRQDVVPAKSEVEIPFLLYVHMKEELAGVNTGIGTAASEDWHWLFKDPA